MFIVAEISMVPAVTTVPLRGCPCLRDSPGTVSLPMFLSPGLAPGKGLGQAHTPLIGSPFRAYVSCSGGAVRFGDVVPINMAPRVIRSLRSEMTHHDMKKEPTSVCLSICPSSRLSKLGCGRWSFRKEAQTRPSPAPSTTSTGGESQGVPRPAEIQNLSSVPQVWPGVSTRMDMP